jgi:hypothetical protein
VTRSRALYLCDRINASFPFSDSLKSNLRHNHCFCNISALFRNYHTLPFRCVPPPKLPPTPSVTLKHVQVTAVIQVPGCCNLIKIAIYSHEKSLNRRRQAFRILVLLAPILEKQSAVDQPHASVILVLSRLIVRITCSHPNIQSFPVTRLSLPEHSFPVWKLQFVPAR